MSKKHYEMIARLLLQARRKHATAYPAVDVCLQSLAIEFADELARDNPAFNRARFLGACK